MRETEERERREIKSMPSLVSGCCRIVSSILNTSLQAGILRDHSFLTCLLSGKEYIKPAPPK